jgi:hypothetical protein
MTSSVRAGFWGTALALMAMGVVIMGQGTTGVTVKPNAVSKEAATPPSPATGSKQTTTAGVNKTKVSTANTASDTDSVWVERIDVDGDGNTEDTNVVWDDEDKVLFAYRTGTFSCQNGGTATADLLVAAYGTGNSGKKPVGSGFWVADLDKGDCGVQAAAMWGCKFDANGNSTACGVATLDEKSDDITIVTASK